MAFHAMLTSLAQKHNIAHLLVPVDRRVVSAAVATELSENPAAAIVHTSTKLGGTIPFTAQMDHAVKAILKAPMGLTPPVSSVLGPKNLLLPASLPRSEGTCCPIR